MNHNTNPTFYEESINKLHSRTKDDLIQSKSINPSIIYGIGKLDHYQNMNHNTNPTFYEESINKLHSRTKDDLIQSKSINPSIIYETSVNRRPLLKEQCSGVTGKHGRTQEDGRQSYPHLSGCCRQPQVQMIGNQLEKVENDLVMCSSIPARSMNNKLELTKLQLQCMSDTDKNALLLVEAHPDDIANSTDCKTIFTYGYGYRQFFHVSENSVHQSNGYLLHMKFKVRAHSDAHLLLSPSPSPSEVEAVYEIVLGAGSNSFSDIRRRRRANTKASAYTKDILSGVELREFWVKMSSKGSIEVGREGDDLPFMQWQDPDPLFIQYFSFCTWSGVAGKWLYDCYSEDGKGSEEVEPEMTEVEKLRKRVLKNYDVYSRPVYNNSEPIKIVIKIEAHHVDIDTKKSVMTVDYKFSLEWSDEKIIWDPTNFDSLGTLHLNHHEIWQPQLVHFNGVRAGQSIGTGSAGMRVSSDGRVRWSPHGSLSSRCSLDLRHWPWDTQVCALQLGFLNRQDSMQLILMENGTQLNLQKTSSEWNVMKLEAESVMITLPRLLDSTAYISDDDDDDMTAPSALTFTFTLKRNNSGHLYILYIPLLVLMMMSLSCCWMDVASGEQLGINCLLSLILCGFLLNLALVLPAPVEHVPYLFKAYSAVLVMVVCATVIAVLVNSFTSSPTLYHPPQLIITVVSAQFVSSIFCLPKAHFLGERDCQQLVPEEQGNSCLERNARARARDSFTWSLFNTLCHRLVFITSLLIYTAVLIW